MQLSLNSTSETLLINKVIAQLLPADGEASNSSISPTNLSKNRSSRSLYTHAVTGIKAVGKMSSNITVKPIVRMKNGVDDELVDAVTYDELAVTLDKKATILGVYEIKCMSFSENLTLIFPVDANAALIELNSFGTIVARIGKPSAPHCLAIYLESLVGLILPTCPAP